MEAFSNCATIVWFTVTDYLHQRMSMLIGTILSTIGLLAFGKLTM